MPPRVVVFDLGNVLVEWDRERLFAQLIDDPEELQFFLDNILTLEVNRRLDAGTPLSEVAEDAASAHPEYRDLVLTFAARWRETVGDVIDGTVDILRELVEAGVPTFALSNWGADTFAMVEDELEFLDLFDGIVISGREGVTKPDPRIFEIVCERFGFSPEQAVFVDDSVENVTAAAVLGFDALRFVGPTDLRHALIERRLLRT